MNELQTWVLIGIFGGFMFTVLVVMSTLFVQVLKAGVGRMAASVDAMGAEVKAISTRLDRGREWPA